MRLVNDSVSLKFLVVWPAVLLLVSTTGWAQDSTISGTVTDSTGRVIPGVEVTVTHLDTGVSRTTATGDSGRYSVPQLFAGNYRVSASMAGFDAPQLELLLDPSQDTEQSFQLSVGAPSHVVEVASSAARINLKPYEMATVIDEKQIQQLPLDGRNVLALAGLSQGILKGNQAGRGDQMEEGFKSGGLAMEHVAISLDGVDNTGRVVLRGPLATQSMTAQPPPEAIAEFKVITNNTSAEYGVKAGATILISTRGGTNQFHGGVYEFHRNAAVSAKAGGLDAPGMEQLTAFRFTSGQVSPDGRKLAYLDELHSHLWVRDLKSDQDQILVAEPTLSVLVWFRDSRKLAYSIRRGRHRSVEWIDLEERKRNSIWQGAAREAPRPLGWSLDGDQLVCRRRLDGGGDQELSFFPLDGGEPVRLTHVPRRARSISLSPDSRFVSYSVSENGAPNLFLLTVGKNEEPLQLTKHAGADLNPTWSWDSRVLFFVRGWDTQLNRAVWAIRVGDRPGKPIRIGPAGDFSPAGGFSVGLNGDLFLGQQFQTATIAVMEIDPSTGKPRSQPVADFPDASYPYKWTPDGKLRYRNAGLIDNTRDGPFLVERDLRTGEERLLPLPADDPIRNFHHRVIVPGGRWELLHNSGGREVFRFDRETRELDLFYESEHPIHGVGPGREGKNLILVTYSRDVKLFRISLMEMESRELSHLATSRLNPWASWSPDNREIAFCEANCLMLISRDGNRLRELACSDPPTEVPVPGWGGPILPRMLWLDMMYLSWSPDGSKILWSVPVLSRDRVELWAVDRETGAHQALWAGEEGYWTIPRQPGWSPQGDRISFSIRKFPPTEVWAMRGALRQAELAALPAR